MPSTTNLIGLGLPPEQAVEISNGSFTTVTTSGAITPTGKVVATAAGIQTLQSTANVNDTTPTAAELIAAFGAAATTGSGFIGVVKDNDADTNCFLVISNGTSYFYLKFTKAT